LAYGWSGKLKRDQIYILIILGVQVDFVVNWFGGEKVGGEKLKVKKWLVKKSAANQVVGK
jgi:hypothetical protein